MVTTLDKEQRIYDYIKANPGCTKTKVETETDMAELTARNIHKKLIDNGKVICVVDEVNPRKHHLFINERTISLTPASLEKLDRLRRAKVEEQIKKQVYTMARLEGGGWIVAPTNIPSEFEII